MKRVFLFAAMLFAVVSSSVSCCNDPYAECKFTDLFNGEDFTGWYFKIRSGDEEMAKRLYVVEDGMVHVFNDEFPNPYNLGATDTYGLFYTNDTYSKYILRFEYKWGETVANQYEKFQYDAGCYYHVTNDKIWPEGVEYQVRYNHITDENHTGDFWIGPKTHFDWYCNESQDHFLPESQGGKLQKKRRQGEHRALEAAPYHGLDGEWNECEIIVMEDKFAIHKLNGVIVNMAENLGFTEGKIGFQSETAEIYYRNIRILEFDEVQPISNFIK